MKLHIIGCGGAGSNVARGFAAFRDKKLMTRMPGTIETVSPIKVTYVDTSINNQQEGSDFYHIKDSGIGEDELSGSGGVIKENIAHIKKAVTEFSDSKGLHASKDLVVIIFSISGGSGSGIGLELCNALMKTNTAILPIVICDDASLQYTTTSIKAFTILNTYATRNHQAIPAMVFNNSDFSIKGDTTKLDNCNELINANLETVSIFTSGANSDLDDKDMTNFFKPTNYTDINLEPGLYTLYTGSYTKKEIETHKLKILLGRTLKHKDFPGTAALSEDKILQYKEGYSNHPEIKTHIDLMISDTLADVHAMLVQSKDKFTIIPKEDLPVISDDEDLY